MATTPTPETALTTTVPEKKGYFESSLAVPAAVGAGVGAVVFGVPILAGATIGAGAAFLGRWISGVMAPKQAPAPAPEPKK